jgi:hypothetical protein
VECFPIILEIALKNVETAARDQRVDKNFSTSKDEFSFLSKLSRGGNQFDLEQLHTTPAL